MNKLGKRDYIKLIADSLVESYGETLKEYGTDVAMAVDLLKELKPYLLFHPQDVKWTEYQKWIKERDPIRNNKE